MEEYRALEPIDSMVCPKCGYRLEHVAPGPNQNEPPECQTCHVPLVRAPDQD
jgi:C4-type Zn-finger protein